jgi:hypothetical protein
VQSTFNNCNLIYTTYRQIRALRITSSEPAAKEVVVGKETWDAGDRVEAGYET